MRPISVWCGGQFIRANVVRCNYLLMTIFTTIARLPSLSCAAVHSIMSKQLFWHIVSPMSVTRKIFNVCCRPLRRRRAPNFVNLWRATAKFFVASRIPAEFALFLSQLNIFSAHHARVRKSKSLLCFKRSLEYADITNNQRLFCTFWPFSIGC